ncbi:MAG: glycosyltransferase [Betaproteobacteria bacterium]|nr:glycosyltransferase [Betaproteobacteria bacterium]
MTRKILFVGMPDSPHAARWINLVADQGWDLHFFPVYLGPVHRLMRGVTMHHPWLQIRPRHLFNELTGRLRELFSPGSVGQRPLVGALPTRSIFPLPVIRPLDRYLSSFKSAPLGESDVCAPLAFGPHVLARLVRQLKPDLIHSMEFQHAGYNVLRAKELFGNKPFPKWLATNWGSDIYYYRRFSEHHQQITRLLKSVDYYSCECERDVGLAVEMGLIGKSMPVLPNTGGFDLEAIVDLRKEVPPSARRMIMVKGYQHFAGRALTALDALLSCSDILGDYRIVVYSAENSIEVYERVEELRHFHGMNISLLAYSSHEKMLKYFAHARIYLGVSISDAISTSMLEAMAMGAFPIQTNTACCNEWFADGVSGFSIPPDDIEIIGSKIRHAIMNDALVDCAAEINWSTVCRRVDQRLLQKKEVAFYDQIFEDIEPSGSRSAA